MRQAWAAGWILGLGLVFAAILGFRVWALDLRPLHQDESVNIYRYWDFKQTGFYAYDPGEYHGPVLCYWTALTEAVMGGQFFARLEIAYRVSIVGIGVLLCGTPILLRGSMDKKSAFFAMILLGFSPAMVFYSRYYIHEMLFVLLGGVFLCCLWRYLVSERLLWAVLAGVGAGLLHATKETCVLVYAAAFMAMLAVVVRNRSSVIGVSRGKWPVHLMISIAVGLGISALLFSSFGQNWQGVIDSYKTFTISTSRAIGTANHTYPAYYYLKLLTWLEGIETRPWNEDLLVLLAGVGVFLSFRSQQYNLSCPPLMRFWTVYTLTITVLYSLIPYKTPWNVLTMLYGMAMTAGIVAAWLWQQRSLWLRGILIVFGLASPLVQCYWLNFKIPADPSNPWVYAHTTEQFKEMQQQVLERAVFFSKEDQSFSIYIIDDSKNYWPWPVYLQPFQVGYWDHIDPCIAESSLVLGPVRMEEALLEALYELPKPGQKHLYLPLLKEPLPLRPGIFWQGYIRKEYADRWRQHETMMQSKPNSGDNNDL